MVVRAGEEVGQGPNCPRACSREWQQRKAGGMLTLSHLVGAAEEDRRAAAHVRGGGEEDGREEGGGGRGPRAAGGGRG